jgi:xanthine/CO dehydrogenase XdhC/CoxF family maturation factor
MTELQALVRAFETLQKTGEEAVLATVVRTRGSTYRRPGARMVMTASQWLAGAISGGCLEGDLLRKAWWRTSTGAPTLVTYDSMSDDETQQAFGLGCQGVVDVLLERVRCHEAPGVLGLLAESSRARLPAAVATVFRVEGDCRAKPGERVLLWPGGRVECDVSDPALAELLKAEVAGAASGRSHVGRYETGKGGQAEVFVEAVLPPLPLVLFGSGPDVLPVVRLAQALGWHVTVVDGRNGVAARGARGVAEAVVVASPEAFAEHVTLEPSTVAVAMTHNFTEDLGLLRTLLPSRVRYVGLLGPRRRAVQLLQRLSEEGLRFTEEQLARLHAPVGLDLGAEGPEQIALSIIAEVQAVLSGRTGESLHRRPGTIHTGESEPPLSRPAESLACAVGQEGPWYR